ncbi:TPA: hypothetical protein DEO28_02600 [Candidatus Dependentiae bacterium]|nr:MAG: hypothetical protein UR14_C0005G0123 [candidate division TM6 bacterium GW2011_GWE2_31_21]KKP53200.1 MAG: hypothetical protein UR43_C0007G0124 [candidate division TM6 bacterium GW2011_GWF2_33_332]HBS48018.1 hypothetical protein [Candidatus Dependentiae bacterium]HBZ73378.1 hypothetical protein [Candidatus Dependentiae bacterium]
MLKKYLFLISLTFGIFNLNCEIEKISIQLKHLKCHHCYKLLANELLKMESVRAVNIDDQHSSLSLELNKKTNFNLSSLKNIIETSSDYKLVKTEIIATGWIIQEGNFLAFSVKNSLQKIYLAEVLPPQNKKEENTKDVTQKVKNVGKKAWSATSSYVQSFTAEAKFEEAVKKYSQNHVLLELTGLITEDAKGKIWLTNKKHAQLKDVAAEKSKKLSLAFR